VKRNCLFIVVDCLRADKCWGENKTARTPNIDSLCRRGTIFTQAIATTTTTSPSFSSILTGLYPFGHGVRSLYGYKLKPAAKTLAQVFAENGYHTYAEVTGPLMPQIGISKGFDHYHLRDKSENMYSSWYDNLLARFAAKQFEEPYFIFIHFFELHMPRLVAREYDNGNFGKNRYERALSSLDARLGKLLSCVDDNTVIILHADHGEKFPETMIDQTFLTLRAYYSRLKRRLGKTDSKLHLVGHGFHVYDYLVRVPLVFVGKDIFPKATVIRDQVRQIDIFPTIAEALELKYDYSRIHGRSLLPLINGEAMPEIPAYCEACGAVLPDKTRWLVGIRTSKYKYVFGPYANDIPDELYDLERDPNEKKNIVAKSPEVARELKQWLQEIKRADEAAVTKRKIQRLKAHGKA